jgi:hypothetical protein
VPGLRRDYDTMGECFVSFRLEKISCAAGAFSGLPRELRTRDTIETLYSGSQLQPTDRTLTLNGKSPLKIAGGVFITATKNVPSVARVAAGTFGFLIFSHAFDGPDLYGALSFFGPSLLEIFPRHRLLTARRVPLGPQVAANRNRLVIDDVEIDRAELWIAKYQYLYAPTVLEF